jgi:hypothetical protein
MPPFQIGIQIRTPRRQFHRLDSYGLQDPDESVTEFCISIVQQIMAAIEKTCVRKTDVSRHLPHPALVRRDRDSNDAYLARGDSHAR